MKLLLAATLASGGNLNQGERILVGLVELPLFLILLLLAFILGQKWTNKFGPVPIGLREYWRIGSEKRVLAQVYVRNKLKADKIAKKLATAEKQYAKLQGKFGIDPKMLGITDGNQHPKLIAATEEVAQLRTEFEDIQAMWDAEISAVEPPCPRIQEIFEYRWRNYPAFSNKSAAI
ncbi:hypothetical protein ACFOWX_08765 [Sphingorhabdus arenilitoris]|uniref:Uncharacterized protein n=1 Tax=Sphingorhabdus arenilitoris TaxID=1490041 RepID=A0ABV8RID3_9SPHN